jgi:hypothetical protein
VVVILGGQPGAGKTELERITRLELGNNVISCNADIFRDHHPDAERIKHRHEAEYPGITADFAQQWNNGLRDYCEAHHLNYILETTFSSGKGMNETIKSLTDKGYRVEIKLATVHPVMSLLGTHIRFEYMKQKENSGRLVGKEAHDSRFFKIQPTLLSVESASLYNKLQLYGRNISGGEKLFLDGVYLLATNPKNTVQVFQEEIDRDWRPEEKRFFDQSVDEVLQLKERRNAPAKEIEDFMSEMKTEYPTQKQGREQVARQIADQKATELLNKRLVGELPHINIAGTDFTIDLRLKELRETAAPWNKIDISAMEVSPLGEKYLMFFHTKTHKLYEPKADIKSLPKNVVVVEIPNEIGLDPVEVAQSNDLDVSSFVKDHPIEQNLSAIVKPLSDSGLPELIQENIRKEQSERKSQDTGEDLGNDNERGRGISR